MVTIRDEDVHDAHILDTALAVQRSREARVARHMLALAAVVYLLRVTLVPVLTASVPPERFAALTGPHVTAVHYTCLAMFAACYVWARCAPLNATLTAGVLFLSAVVPGFIDNPTLAGGALLGKLLVLVIVGRAVLAALMYRVHYSPPATTRAKARPATPAPHRLAA